MPLASKSEGVLVLERANPYFKYNGRCDDAPARVSTDEEREGTFNARR